MRGWPFEQIPDDHDQDAPFPLGFVIVFTVLFAVIAAYLLAPR